MRCHPSLRLGQPFLKFQYSRGQILIKRRIDIETRSSLIRDCCQAAPALGSRHSFSIPAHSRPTHHNKPTRLFNYQHLSPALSAPPLSHWVRSHISPKYVLFGDTALQDWAFGPCLAFSQLGAQIVQDPHSPIQHREQRQRHRGSRSSTNGFAIERSAALGGSEDL